MAPVLSVSEHGFDPSCGDFGVKVVRTESYYSSCGSMEVEYDELIDTDEHVHHHAVLPWNGGEVSIKEAERLLNLAHVPVFIQQVSAINLISRFIDELLKDGKNNHPFGLSSVLVKITSDKDTVDYDAYLNDENNEYKGAIDFDAVFKDV